MIEILFENNDLVVCVKPVGVYSQNDKADDMVQLLKEQTGSDIYPVHRLDKETEGLMIYALDAKAAATLSADISEGRWEKTYRAWLWGVPEKESDTLCDLLYYDRARGKSFVVQRERKGVKAASLEYEVISRSHDKKRTLVQIKLHTGRTHQIRVQFSSRKTPLTGDGRYGSKVRDCSIALYSHKIAFNHPRTKEMVEFISNPDFSVYPWNSGSVDNA